MGLELLTEFGVLLLFGLVIMVACMLLGSPNSKRDEQERAKFFKLVEEAREAEMLEKERAGYQLNGTWRGRSDGLFGIGADLTVELQRQSAEISGSLSDQFGNCPIHGYFVWPYIWFDVERHGTIFEFRGTIVELPHASSITGKYRYSANDANWQVELVTQRLDDEDESLPVEDGAQSERTTRQPESLS